MKISYDPEIDALYIRPPRRARMSFCPLVRRSRAQYRDGEKLVGIEILDARSVLGSGKVPAVMLEGVKSASSPLVVPEKPAKKYGT